MNNLLSNLTPAESRVAHATAALVIAELERRGVVHPETKGLPIRMSTASVADELGICSQTVRDNWRAWGLRKLGRNKHGMIFSGQSVAQYKQNQNTEDQ